MSNASLKEQLQAVASQLPKPAASGKPKRQDNPRHDHRDHQRSDNRDHRAAPHKNAKPKPKWLDYAQYGVELLKAYFPNCFKPTPQAQPLKVGIKQDLVKRLSTMSDIVMDDKACMVKSLSYYVNTPSYLKTVTEGATRIDLDGQPAGVVTTEEALYSAEKQKAKLTAKEQKKSDSHDS